ncbi:hypothetical protein BgiBS90_024672, partial [Biomphalaria glabrata]
MVNYEISLAKLSSLYVKCHFASCNTQRGTRHVSVGSRVGSGAFVARMDPSRGMKEGRCAR